MNDNLKTLYQVWHKEPVGYVHAFTVHGGNLAAALVLPMVEPRSPSVTEQVASPRPTTIGDVIVTPDHVAYEVASTKHGITFDLVEFAPARTAKLAAEQREETLAGVEGGLRLGAKLSQIMEEAAAYGVRPEDVIDIRRQLGKELEKESLAVVRADLGEGLRLGQRLSDVMDEAAAYGITPTEVEAIRAEVNESDARQASREEIIAHLADGLRLGMKLFDIPSEAAERGVTPEEVDDIRQQVAEEMEEDRTEATSAIRPLTIQLVECCHLDVWPGRAAVIDFGLDSPSHLGALQYAVREELVTIEELDAAMGDGRKLTEIAQRGDNPYRFVTFSTAWDRMRAPEPEMER